MPLTTRESNTDKESIETVSGISKSNENPNFDLVTERLLLHISQKFIISNSNIPYYGRPELFVPSAFAVLEKIQPSQRQTDWLKSLGFQNILLKLNPKEKISEFNTRILERLAYRQHQIELRKQEIKNLLLEKFHIVQLEDYTIKSIIGSANFILSYLEAQNTLGRNDFSILELAAGDMGDRGYGQNEQLYVPLVCEVLTRSGFVVDGIDRHQDISAQNLDFGQLGNIDLTSDDWEKDIKHRYNMVIFLRNWHSEVFLHRYRKESKVHIRDNDFLVEDFVRNLLPKVYDILEDDGVFFATFPFKNKDLFDIDVVFGRFNLKIFYNLDGLILARKKAFDSDFESI